MLDLRRRADRLRDERCRPAPREGVDLAHPPRLRLAQPGLASLVGGPVATAHPRPLRRTRIWPVGLGRGRVVVHARRLGPRPGDGRRRPRPGALPPVRHLPGGGPIAITYAARHPERVSHVVVYGTCARATWAHALEQRRRELALGEPIRVSWGSDQPGFRQVYDAKFLPDGPLETWRAFDELQRRSTSARNAYLLWRAFGSLDCSDAARRLDVPTLILHANDDQVWSFEEGTPPGDGRGPPAGVVGSPDLHPGGRGGGARAAGPPARPPPPGPRRQPRGPWAGGIPGWKQAGALDCFVQRWHCLCDGRRGCPARRPRRRERGARRPRPRLATTRRRLATPAPGWTIADQIAHLGWTDEVALLAATDPEAFAAAVAAFADGPASVDDAAASAAARPPAELLAWWRRPGPSGRRPRRRSGRDEAAMVRSADERGVDGDGRLMETWAHGQDVADALGVEPANRPTGCATSPTSACAPATTPSTSTASTPPAEEFRGRARRAVGRHVDLGSAAGRPAGDRAGARLLPARHPTTPPRRPRRHAPRGADAEQWLTIAQAFAGPPGAGRPPERST